MGSNRRNQRPASRRSECERHPATANFLEPDFWGVWAAHFYGTGVLRQVGVPCRHRMLTDFAGVISRVPVSGQCISFATRSPVRIRGPFFHKGGAKMSTCRPPRLG